MKMDLLKTLTVLMLSTVITATAAADLSIQPVSLTTRTNIAGTGGSFLPALSADGHFVAFISQANNLVTNDDLSPYLDVFLRDLDNGATVLVSASTSGRGGGNGDSNDPSISSDGRYIAFASEANDLVANDTNQASDVFVFDRLTGQTTLVSVNRDGGTSLRRPSSRPVISANGQWIVFQSLADDLADDQITSERVCHLYARDLQAGKTYLVSVPVGMSNLNLLPGNYESHSPVITPDGARVAFVSTLTNLVSGVVNPNGGVYVRDLSSQTTFLIYSNTAALTSLNPAMSADGRYVAFIFGSYLYGVYHHDLKTGESQSVSNAFLHSGGVAIGSTATGPSLSADGHRLAYEAWDQLYVWDAPTGSNILVTVNAVGTGPAQGISQAPVISADGRKVVFLSAAADLLADTQMPTNQYQIYVRDIAAQTTRLVSAGISGQPAACNMAGFSYAISQTGQHIAFESTDDSLAVDDINLANDVVIRDLVAGTNLLVSQRAPALPASTSAASARSYGTSLSIDGRFAVFTANDNNLAPGDTNRWWDVFRHDLTSGTVQPISLDTNGLFRKDLAGTYPVISANGQYVLFLQKDYSTSAARWLRWDANSGTAQTVESNLSYLIGIPDGRILSGDMSMYADLSSDGNLAAYLNSSQQLYLRDIGAGTTRLITSRFDMDYPVSMYSSSPRFSPDARWLAYKSQATDLITNNYIAHLHRKANNEYDLFATEVATLSKLLLSVDADGFGLPGNSEASAFSASGQHLAFYGTYVSGTISVARSYLFDFNARSNTLICTNCSRPWPSGEGRWVAYQSQAAPADPSQIMLKDLFTGAETLVSANYQGTGGGNGPSTAPQISPDGRFIVFASTAGDLVANDMNHASDIFVYDRILGRLLLASANRQGTGAGNRCSVKPVMSADGRTVLFESYASDLIEGDYNETADVLVLRLGAGDDDDDGLPDDWEAAYFGDLSRDGAGDLDGDGQPDRQEYLAGTDPTNQGSVLQVLTLASVSGGPTTLLWSAVPGKTYAVQYKDRLEDPWSALPGTITATGGTASALDAGAPESAQRFYRVILVP